MDLHFHFHCTDWMSGDANSAKLDLILKTLKEFQMTVSNEVKGLSKEIDDASNEVAARLDRQLALIKNSMSDEEVTEVKGGLTAIRDHLKAMGKDPENPIPPLPPEPPAATTRHKK